MKYTMNGLVINYTWLFGPFATNSVANKSSFACTGKVPLTSILTDSVLITDVYQMFYCSPLKLARTG